MLENGLKDKLGELTTELDNLKEDHAKELAMVKAQAEARAVQAQGVGRALAVDEATLPRVSNAMTIAELKVELKARDTTGKFTKGLSSWSKGDFMCELGQGTPRLSAVAEYRCVEELRDLVKRQKCAVERERQRVLREQEEERRRKREEEQEEMRRQEIERQREEDARLAKHEEGLHTHTSLCHGCPLAPTRELLIRANEYRRMPRDENPLTSCDVCNVEKEYNPKVKIVWSCVKCDYDICWECYQVESLPEDQRDEKRKEIAKMKEAERKAEIKRKEQERKKLEAEQKRIQAEKLRREKEIVKSIGGPFPDKIVTLTSKNRMNENGKGFCVISTCGYDADGWHSYGGPPEEVFDSYWTSQKEAIQRAHYLFYCRNPWGLHINEILDKEVGFRRPGVSPTGWQTKLCELRFRAGDSERWTVIVVKS
uniref:Uncharacterized protein n=2 Tax=Hemiselmis andersenii TaxID=464988 RepID=A0A7S1HA41_HEMAN